MDKKIKKVLDFYAVTHKLKNILRTGQIAWQIDAERFESVAEHIYGAQMLAIAINAEFDLGLDIGKVLSLLAIHELGEIVIGDISPVGSKVTKEKKHEFELKAIEKLVKPLDNSGQILELFQEFENRETEEAKFAYFMDKLDMPLQCKFFEESGFNDLYKPRTGEHKKLCDETIARGGTRLFDMWADYDKKYLVKDEFYNQFIDYALEHDVFGKSIGRKKLR